MNMNMVKQAQKMQQDMLKMQEEMEQKAYEATAGGGVVTAQVNGKHEVVALTIDAGCGRSRRMWKCSRTWSLRRSMRRMRKADGRGCRRIWPS